MRGVPLVLPGHIETVVQDLHLNGSEKRYAGSRYRLIGLTPQEARQLAAVLAHAANMPGMASGPDSQEG